MSETGVNPKLPTWDGDWKTFTDYKLACQLEQDGLKEEEQITLAPRLARNLTGKAWEACLDIDRSKLRAENGLVYLLDYLKQRRGKQQVDVLGEAFEKYFQSSEVTRHERENLNDFEQRLAVFTRDIKRALQEMGTSDNVPSEIYGWFLLNKHIRLEPSDIATLKSQTSSYKLPNVLAALRKMWGGDSLTLKDQEKKRLKTYLACGEDEAYDNGDASVWWNEDETGSDGHEEEEPTDAEVWFEEALNAYAQNPNDEAVLASFQEAKKSFYKEARRALDKSRVSRGFYPETKGKSKGKGKQDGKMPELRGRCMRKMGPQGTELPAVRKRTARELEFWSRLCAHRLGHFREQGHLDSGEQGHHDSREQGHHDSREQGHHDSREQGHHDSREQGTGSSLCGAARGAFQSSDGLWRLRIIRGSLDVAAVWRHP